MANSRWAVILCKFEDDTDPTLPIEHYKRLFTGAGVGSFNMVDFFSTMSHGKIDTSGSQVFGWFKLALKKAAYAGNVPSPPQGKVNRDGLVAACRQAASDGGVPLSSFDGVVVSMSGQVDLFGYVGGMAAFCDVGSLSPSPLGQEMGHGYGLDHARRNGSDAEYQDPWDVMSVYDSCFMQTNDEWGTVGPGLNAWCMRSVGWLDETRVWSANDGTPYNTVIHLRPLHRHDLPGLLAADVSGYLIEYRAKERWDADFPRSAVFIHRFQDNHSYVMTGSAGQFDLVAGDVFESGDPNGAFSAFSQVEVIAIDDTSLTATLRLTYRPHIPLRVPELVGRLVGGVAVGGGGGIIIGGVYHPVGPVGPVTVIIQQLANYLAVNSISNAAIRSAAQRDALTAITQAVAAQMTQLQPMRTPAPLTNRRTTTPG